MIQRYNDITCVILQTIDLKSILFTKVPNVVLTMSNGPLAQDQQNFVQTSTFFNFYLDIYIYKNKFKNLIRTSKLKFSF